jgi:phosphoglycolate phosphatase-like HAD superfamily hydrolase
VSLRIGIDLDGTLANLSKLYREVEQRFLAPESRTPEALTEKEQLKAARQGARQQSAVWKALQGTPDLWTRLEPLEDGAVRRLYECSVASNWEVFFITQRPKSAGASVQRQTQQWLVAQGFEYPSVLTLRGPRGKAAHALDLDFLLDDLAQNCVDVVSDSRCRPILVLREPDPTAEAAARQLRIGIVRSIHEAVDVLREPSPEPRETGVARVLKKLGFA